MVGASWKGQTPGNIATKLAGMQARAKNMRPVMDAWGRRITLQSIPDAVMAGGKPKFKPVLRFGVWAATPLWNTGKMVGSIYYEARNDGCGLFTGKNTPQAALMHRGGTIRPVTSKYLTIPVVPEAAGKSPRDFPGGFFLVFRGVGHATGMGRAGGLGGDAPRRGDPRGYRGPGYYRKTGGDAGNGIEKIFALVRSSTIPPRPWFKSQPEDHVWLDEVSAGYVVRNER